jgi:hypothetical protein
MPAGWLRHETRGTAPGYIEWPSLPSGATQQRP